MSTEVPPKDIEPIDLKKLYEATFVDKPIDEWNIQFMKPVDQLSQLLMVISEFKTQLKFMQEIKTDESLKVWWRICFEDGRFSPCIHVLKEKCPSELQIEPRQLSPEEITRETIDKIFNFMPNEEARINRLKDSLDETVYAGFYWENEAIHYSRLNITAEFAKYVERGESIRIDNHPHLQNIIKAFLEVQHHAFGFRNEKVPNPLFFPFFLVCCSSETGKTQLPFSLPKAFPIFYFLLNRKPSPRSKSIYGCFSSVSITLQMCIEKDLEKLKKSFEDNEEGTHKKDGEPAAKKLKENVESIEYGKANVAGTLLSPNPCLDAFPTKMPFFTLGFIVSIMEKYFSSDGSNSSLEFLTRLETFKFESMTCSTAKETIRELCEKNKVRYTPIIFIDETNLSRDMKLNDEILLSFLFLRTVLRLIHVIPVFMGTNFYPATYFLTKKTDDTRSVDNCYHTYVIYNLPPIPAKICEEEERKSIGLVTQNMDAKKVVETIYEFLKNERPLFFHDLVEDLNGCLESKFPIDFKELFVSLISNLFRYFRKRKYKSYCNWEFNYSQLCFLASKNREMVENRETDNLYFTGDGFPFFSDIRYINWHTGFLVGPANCAQCSDNFDEDLAAIQKENIPVTDQLIDTMHTETTVSMIEVNDNESKVIIKENSNIKVAKQPNEDENSSYSNTDTRATFFKLFSSVQKFHGYYPNQYYNDKNKICDYNPFVIFPNNQKYCLSGLALAALKEDRSLIFTDEYDKSERISTLNALCDIIVKIPCDSISRRKFYIFQPVLALFYTAIVIASHVDGFETTTMKHFLRAFVHELDYGAVYDKDDTLPSIDFTGLQDLESRTNDKFPYLAPTDQQWNTEFVGFVNSIFPNFQYGTASYPKKGSDMFVNMGNSLEQSSRTFMCIEIKCLKEFTSEASIKVMANRLLKNSGQFFLLAVWKLEENDGKKNEKEIGSKKNANVSVAAGNEGNIFLLRKQKRGQEEKKFDFYFDCMQRDEKSTKIVFALDLGTINGNSRISAIAQIFPMNF